MKILLALCLLAAGNAAHAALTPISINVVPPAQFPPDDFSVTGARISALVGKQRDLYGLDLGVIGNITTQTFTGLAVSGIFNYTAGQTTVLGLQLAGLANIATQKADIYGLQLTAGVNSLTAASKVVGLQFALLANIAPFTDIYGFQIGLYNRAASVHGFQIGLVNSTNSLHGIQLGLVNINQAGPFKISPVLNVGF